MPFDAPRNDAPRIWRTLDLSDLAAVDDLHRRAIGAAGPDVVKPEHPDFFAAILGGRGRMIGVFAADRLIAYGVLQHVIPADDDPRPLVGAGAAVQRVKLAGASVAPDQRGSGLQRALISARVRLAHENYTQPLILYATSAPGNTASWSNLLAEGFHIRGIKLYYGGYPRYVMVNQRDVVDWGAQTELDPGDIDAQARLLERGWRGIAARRAKDGTALVFAHPRTEPSS